MSEETERNLADNERLCPECGKVLNKAARMCVHCGVPLTPETATGDSQTGAAGTGLEPNLAAALSYLLTWITGIIFLLVEKDNDYVRFHAKQAIVFGVATIAIGIALSIFFTVIAAIPFIGAIIVAILGTLVWFVFVAGCLVLWVVLMVKAYQGQRYELPILGNLVNNWNTG